MELNKYFDHTLLKADAKIEDVEKLCQEALKYDFASVCVNPTYVETSKGILSDAVPVCTVVGFPLGANTTRSKLYEAKDVIAKGATEIDYVINISDVKNGYYDKVKKEMQEIIALKETTKNLIIKVILENCYLEKNEITKVCEIAKECKIDFVKTSTGFGTGGAELEDIILMKEVVGDTVKVKASGGVRDYNTCMEFINAGVDRIGASASVEILKASK